MNSVPHQVAEPVQRFLILSQDQTRRIGSHGGLFMLVDGWQYIVQITLCDQSTADMAR
ncbi:hypothetical protein ACFSS8_08980 [Paracoccus kondratievae]